MTYRLKVHTLDVLANVIVHVKVLHSRQPRLDLFNESLKTMTYHYGQ